MNKEATNSIYNFSEHEFPDIKLEKCGICAYSPSQEDSVTIGKNSLFIIVKDGKGTISISDKRHVLTRGNGIAVCQCENIKIKSDSIEPFTLIFIHIAGKSAQSIISAIEKKEGGHMLSLGLNSRVYDTANDLISECSKSYSTDYGILLAFYDFINSINDQYLERKIPTKNVYMTQAVEYIKQNYNKNISVENIANLLGIERSYLSRLFKTHKNKSTQNYIIDYRMHKAKKMFEEEDMNVSQVCSAVGYTNIYCFSRIFKSRVGMPPKEYMENCRKRTL